MLRAELGRHKDRTRPALGNHEYKTGNANGYFQYFGASAGDPSKGYYSYDLGGWHIVVLNTNDHCNALSCDAASDEEKWLRSDLAASTTFCTIAIWQDPRFSSSARAGGSHKVKPFWDALYDYGADLVVNADEHNYERFAPQTPFGALDPLTRSDLQREFLALQQRLGKTVLFVTHDLHEALRLGTRIALLEQGRLVSLTSAEEFRKSSEPLVVKYMEAFGERADQLRGEA